MTGNSEYLDHSSKFDLIVKKHKDGEMPWAVYMEAVAKWREEAHPHIVYLGRLLPRHGLEPLSIDAIIEARTIAGLTPAMWALRQDRVRFANSAGLTKTNSRFLYNTQREVWDIRMRCWHRDVNRQLRQEYYPPTAC